MASLTVDDDGFGGKVVPPVTPETGIEYNWQGYAVIKHRDINGPVSGLMKLRIDDKTGEVEGILTLSDGLELAINKDAFFYFNGSNIHANGTVETGQNNPFRGGRKTDSAFVVYSEDGQFMISLGGADLYDQEGLAAYAQTRVWAGQYIDKGKGKGFYVQRGVKTRAGTLTPLADMVRGDVSAYYSGGGKYTSSNMKGFRSLSNNMEVNFGSATWSGNWYGFSRAGIKVNAFGPGGFSVNASGDIAGNQFTSNRMGSNWRGQNATGSIQGAFNGAQAQRVSGSVDITVSPNYAQSTQLDIPKSQRYVGVFAAQKRSEYSNDDRPK